MTTTLFISYNLLILTNEHQITPPPELVEQWLESTRSHDSIGAYPPDCEQRICTAAARWGADQELEACCEWIYKLMDRGLEWSMDLRADRRPKPPSLKEQALQAINAIDAGTDKLGDSDIIRRALEQLDE